MNPLSIAEEQAQKLLQALKPFAGRIEVAGSIRRRRPVVHDVELVIIPDPSKLIALHGFIKADPRWRIQKGKVGGKYIQFSRTPFSDQLDLFFASERNWGVIYAIRTGSAEFSHNVLAAGWKKKGFESKNGLLYEIDPTRADYPPVEIHEERDLFEFLGIKYVPPEARG